MKVRRSGPAAGVFLALVALVILNTGTAGAVVTPTSNADALAEAMDRTNGAVTGAAMHVEPPAGNPAAVADSELALFPLNGSSYTVLSSGDATAADDDDDSEMTSTDNGGDGSDAGPGVFDRVTLRVDLQVPASKNCLTVDYRFLTEEFSEFVGSEFNDAFLAELDASNFTLQSDGTVIAANNFAVGPDGNVTTVNSAGTSADNAFGTTYDGATPVVRATTPITPGAHSVFFTVYDAGDAIYDSTAFIDNLRLRSTDPENCVRGAADPDEEAKLCQGEEPTIFTVNGIAKGTNGDDVILGSSGPDVIKGRGGDDIICPLGGPDLVRGQRGADSITGGRGRDDLRGNGGNDVLRGGRGSDVVSGQAGEDFVKGARGDDKVFGGRADDRVVGNSGEDQLFGRRGNDILRGGKDDDSLAGGPDSDACFGGQGKDSRIGCES